MTRPSLRRGWCPGALRPMQTGDGLLVRIRLRGGLLPISVAQQLAEAARRYGNGLIDVSARANLQLRGISQESHRDLLEFLAGSDLLDADPDAEAVRNIMASPLAGLPGFGAACDITRISAELDARIAEDHWLHSLPGKFGFLIDDGGWPSLADVAADIRFEACLGNGVAFFRVGLGGTAQSAAHAGFCTAEDVTAVAIDLARRFLDLRNACGNAPLRMRDVRSERAISAFAGCPRIFAEPPSRQSQRGQSPPSAIGLMSGEQGQRVLALGVTFGRLTAANLDRLAEAAQDLGTDALRIGPGRMILLALAETERLRTWMPSFEAEGFILDADDPRRAVAACPGAPACRNATTKTQADALRLAPLAQKFAKHGIGLHVSGCEKGCAHPQPAPVTLVADAGLYRLVVDGTPQDGGGDTPFPVAAAPARLETLLAARSS